MNLKKLRVVLEIGAVAAVLAVAGLLYYVRTVESIDKDPVEAHAKPYVVEAGMNARTISEDLTEGKVPSIVLRIWIQRHPELQAVQKGRYRIDGKKTLPMILRDMVQGKIMEEEYPLMVIIEGSNISDLYASVKKVASGRYEELKKQLSAPADFIIESLQHDQKLLEAVGGAGSSLEGLLMPATYPVFHKERPLEPVSEALRATARFMAAEWPRRSDRINVKTPYEALTVASIIERETLVDSERPSVAAVFYNRMRKHMRLQTDPTVMYGISPDFSGRLSKAQLKQDTPYNTYTRDGLPPTPISMPSKASILAALHPADTDALYFVAADVSPAQGHVFTATLNEHNKAVAAYRKKVSDYRKKQAAEKKAEKNAEKVSDGGARADPQNSGKKTAQTSGRKGETVLEVSGKAQKTADAGANSTKK